MTQPVQTKTRVDTASPVSILRFDGDITSASRDAVLGVYEALPAVTSSVALDFSRVPYLNSSGIALVIQLVMAAGRAARPVAIFGLTPHFQKVFVMVGLKKYTTIHPDEASALASLRT